MPIAENNLYVLVIDNFAHVVHQVIFALCRPNIRVENGLDLIQSYKLVNLREDDCI